MNGIDREERVRTVCLYIQCSPLWWDYNFYFLLLIFLDFHKFLQLMCIVLKIENINRYFHLVRSNTPAIFVCIDKGTYWNVIPKPSSALGKMVSERAQPIKLNAIKFLRPS